MKRQISLDGIIKQAELLQFDDKAVYIGRGDKPRIVSLEDIVSMSKTSTALNNRYFWELVFRVEESKESVKFRPNNTIWNRNFPQFHALLSKVNPEAIKTPYHWWYF